MQHVGFARVAALLAASTFLFAVAAVPAAADHVQCGAVITEDTKLDSDLTCPFDPELEGVAITIAANDVTLDLGGHRITGPGIFSDTVGISVRSFHRAVIRNGAIGGFSIQVVVRDANSTVLRRLTTGNVLLWGNSNALTRSATAGIDVRGDRNRIARNTISGPFNSQGSPEWLDVEGKDNAIARNAVVNVIPGRDEDSTGMALHVTGGEVIGNTVMAGNYGPPRPFQSTRGIELVGEGTVVRGNTVAGHEDGFYVAGAFDLIRNIASNNFDDGIEAALPGATITRNTANNNGDFGIEAVPGTIDGGGNRAAGNGNPAQCVGVRCK